MPDIVKEEKYVYTLGHYVYAFADFNVSLTWVPIKNSMLRAKAGKQFSNIVLKEGMELYYNTNTVNYNYGFYQLSMCINTLDDPYFPTKGLYLNVRYKYNFQIRSDQSETSLLDEKQTNDNEIINFHYQQYFLIAKRVSVIPELSFGTMSEKAFITEKFFLGGMNYSLRPNTYNFAGIRTNYIATDNFFMIGISAQLMLRKKWSFQVGFQNLLIANYADYELEDNETELDDNYFGSWKAGIGYQSKVGPIRFILSKSPERKEFVWSLNIGVPF
jgi:outer membrane protein assembly factor BamA